MTTSTNRIIDTYIRYEGMDFHVEAPSSDNGEYVYTFTYDSPTCEQAFTGKVITTNLSNSRPDIIKLFEDNMSELINHCRRKQPAKPINKGCVIPHKGYWDRFSRGILGILASLAWYFSSCRP